MWLDQNLYLCKKQSKNGVKDDNIIVDKYFRKNHELHRAVKVTCLEGASTNVEFIFISKEQWNLICEDLKKTEESIERHMEYTTHDREWVIENLDEFEMVREELEAMEEFENGVIYYYSWWWFKWDIFWKIKLIMQE